ncbi:MAG: hypothetical protein OEY91_11230, partial [Nitrospirota bacterium]|nr:hypothetical protein [Nitrospirota bacterium]
MGAIFRNLALTLCSILIFLGVFEIFLRGWGYKIVTFYADAGFYQYDPDLGWEQIPNYEAKFRARDFEVNIKTNAYGLRDQEYAFSKKQGINRIIVLGDSFAWGWGVEQNEIFCEVAEHELNGFEFINLGNNGYGTGQEYLIFEKLGRRFSPDLTVLAFYANDVSDNNSASD